MNNSKKNIKELTRQIKDAMLDLVKSKFKGKCWIVYYGANDIHPKNLVYWICVQTDKEKAQLKNDKELNQELRGLLTEYQYPASGRDKVHIGFESQETVDKVSNGSWWLHWK